MLSNIARLIAFFVACTLASVWSSGAASRQDVLDFWAEPDAFKVRLGTPVPRVVEQSDGTHRIEIEGFGTPERRPGAPDIPHRTYLVAIPRDADPTLVVRAIGEHRLVGVRPGAVSDRRGAANATETPGPRIAPSPGPIAWLGRTGVLRDQRYVELHVAPVRYDPVARGLIVAPTLEIEIRFGSSIEPVPPATDPRFEPVFRESFLNYEQGRTFRLSATLDTRASVAPTVSPREASGVPRQRIRVSQDGLRRIDYAALQPTGLLAYPVGTWILTNQGGAVPLQIQDDGDGTIEPGEWIQFYGEAFTNDPKTVLNTDIPDTDADLFEARDYTDVNTYFLTVAGGSQPAVTELDGAPTLTRTPPTQFTATRHVEVDDAFRPLGGADPWYWSPSLPLSPPSSASRTDSVSLPGLASGTAPIVVREKVRGVTEDLMVTPDHATRVTVRNAQSTQLALQDATFDGRSLFLHTIPWTFPGSGAQVTQPLQIRLEVLPTSAMCGSTACNTVILDYIEVDYQHAFTVDSESLSFSWPDSNAEFVVSGLADSTPEIYEITRGASTGPVTPRRLIHGTTSGAGPFSVRFRVDQDPGIPDGTPRRFLVAGDAAILPVPGADFQPDTISDLRDTSIQADMIVIGHPAVLDDSAGSPLSLLLAHRSSPQGGGLTSRVVRIQDVEDEFNFGLSGPQAIREFLRWVMSTEPGEGWADPKPSYVMLIGDGSYDYKGGTAKGSYVPTQVMFQDDPQFGHYTSDNLLAAVVGDDSLADLMIGRIPVRTLADANVILQKILAYEQALPTGSWRDHVLFISDRGKTENNPGEALDFENINASGISQVQAPPYTVRNLRYWSDYYNSVSQPWNAMRSAILAAVNGVDPLFPTQQGASVVQYVGHGNTVVWSDDAFFDERINPPADTAQDTQQLTNGGRLPFLFVHNCLTGAFHDVTDNTMGENWLRRINGGAVGVFGPSGLSFNFIGAAATEEIWTAMFGPEKERHVGRIALDTLVRLCTQGSVEDCQNYVLLGDPASRLALHDIDPPQDLVAVSGNASADLTWTASATPGVTYTVFRTASLSQPNYMSVATGLAVPSFHDSGLTNTSSYYYYVVARDGAGFDSAWSNFNSDCAVNGPDCVRAVPLNPNPPAPPVGVVLEDSGIGTQMEVSWLKSPESDLAYYTVHYGPTSGGYTGSLNTGKLLRGTIGGLTEGQTYYFAVTATNTSGFTSGPSSELSDSPIFALGLRGPALIADLRLGKSGSDVRLEWDPVTSDFYGKSESVATYQVFRGNSPAWTSLALIGSCASPCTSYLDPGALALPGRVHYRVRAVDVDSNVGGLGSDPPARTDLGLAKGPTAGSLRLEWDPVLLTVGGVPAQLSHYAVYSSASPFSREMVRDGLVPLLTTTTSASLDLTPAEAKLYYSVLAVDIRGNVSPF